MRTPHRTYGSRIARLRTPWAHQAGAIGKGLAMLWTEGNCTTERHCDLEGLRPDVDSDSKRCGHITAAVDTRPSTSAPNLENQEGDRGQSPGTGSSRIGED